MQVVLTVTVLPKIAFILFLAVLYGSARCIYARKGLFQDFVNVLVYNEEFGGLQKGRFGVVSPET